MPSSITMKALLETGVHFGHRTPKWNPKMEPYIFTQRNGIHIIDLQQTLANLNQYHDMIRDLVMDGGTVLFVGTKRQAQESIAREAERCHMPYVNYRWLGGTLTNWRTIRERIDTLKKLEKRREKGEFEYLTKKEALMMERKIEKLQLRLGGIREMTRLPDLVFVVDTEREMTAVKEANILGIPVMALADTNTDPDYIDYIIPANDDAVRAIKLIVSAVADAVLEGQAMRKVDTLDDEGQDYEDISAYDDFADDDDNEILLGARTLEKLRDPNLFADDDDDDSADDDGDDVDGDEDSADDDEDSADDDDE